MKLKKVKVEDAVGLRLGHDLTRIVPGYKGAAFRNGQIIRREDIPTLLDMGKKQVYVLKPQPGEVHEDEAARRMARALSGRGVDLRGPREGKMDFIARTSGLLKIKVSALEKVNRVGLLIVASRHNHSVVSRGDVVGGTRIIPLTIRDAKIKKVEEIGRRSAGVFSVVPFRSQKVGVIVTGSEIFEGRIKDRSAEIVGRKVKALGSRVARKAVLPDDAGRIGAEIRGMKSAGCTLIVTTGGLSVDPDDVTLAGIRSSGAKVVFYGAPVLPGSMSAYALLGKTVILGAPACVVHDPVTALDLFLPRVLAGDPILAKEAALLGHGSFCLKCSVCRYPLCPFGKG